MTGADDPYLLTLGQIASELTAIRRELQQLNHGDSTSANTDEFECRSCGALLEGESVAQYHAEDEHNAPADAWRDLYE